MEHAKAAPKKAKAPNETPIDAVANEMPVDAKMSGGKAGKPPVEAREPEERPKGKGTADGAMVEKKEGRLSHIELGKRGEQAARSFLNRRGMEIVAANWTCPAGEVDIVASDESELRFIEVKTRRGTGKGFPEEAVDAEKQRRYERIAEYFLQGYESTEVSVHFDVIGIITTAPDRAFLRYHRDAFSAC